METAPKSPVVAEVAALTAAPTNEVITNAVAMEVVGTSNSNPPAAAVEVAAVAAPQAGEVPTVAMELGGTSREAQGTPEERKRGTPDAAAQPAVKRGRGRPKGSANKPKLAPIGALPMETAGSNWIPYIITVEAGEDIRQRVFGFSPNASVSSAVVSAVGPVCRVHLSPSNSRLGCVRHEGYFEIVFISASRTLSYTADGRCQATSVFSIKLANPEGSLFGGYATGPVIAAGPVQIVMASFEQARVTQWRAANSLECSMHREMVHRESAVLQVQTTANGGTPGSGNSDIHPGNGKEPDVGQKSSEPKSLPVVDAEPVPTSNAEEADSDAIQEKPTSPLSQHQTLEEGGQNHEADINPAGACEM